MGVGGAPLIGVGEQLGPGRGGESTLVVPLLRHVGPLPGQGAPLGVGHDGQVAAVLGTEGGHSAGAAVGVERVLLRRPAPVVHVAHAHQLAGLQLLQQRVVPELEAACAPGGKGGCGKGSAVHPFDKLALTDSMKIQIED